MALLLQDSAFVEGFSKSALMILVSEIGDKTFFIAAIMAMRHPQLTARRGGGVLRGGFRAAALTRDAQVLAGALGALWVMTALSAAMGWAAPALVRSNAACPAPAASRVTAPHRLSRARRARCAPRSPNIAR